LSVKNHSDLSNEITTDITNNGSELVTGLVLQSKLLDLADSAINILGDTVQGKLTYSSLFSISNTGDLTHKKYVDDSITSAVSAIDFTPYIKKDGSVLWTGDSDHNGHNIKNVSLISGVSGSEIDITAATDFTQGWLSVAPTYSALGFNNVGQVKVDNSGISIFSVVSGKIISLSTPGAVDIASSADNVNIESTTGDINLISHGYTAKLPSSAPGTNTYLKYDGTNYVWASASGGGTTTNSLSVDNSSLQLNSGTTFDGSAAKTISVKALGITNAMLAGSIADGKLASSYLYADGTRALTGDWGVGTFSITGIKSFAISGTAGAGYGEFIAQSSAPSAPSVAGFRLSAGSTGNFGWTKNDGGTDTFRRSFSGTLTSNRVFTWQDLSYTVAGLDIAQSWTAQQTFTGSATQVATLQLLDTTYKDALTIASGNNLRIGAGFTALTIAPTTISTSGIVLNSGSVTWQPSGAVVIRSTAAADIFQVGNSTNITITSGTRNIIVPYTGSFAPTSGSANFNFINANYAVNQSGTSGNGDIVMFNANPIITSVSGKIYGLRSQLSATIPLGGGTAWNIYADGTASNYLAGNTGIGTSSLGTAFLTIAAATTAKAAMNFISGSAPTSPNDGDFWFDGTNFKARIGGVTKTVV
jgi:hypothetical protein